MKSTSLLIPALIGALQAQAPTEAFFRQDPLSTARACVEKALAFSPKQAEYHLLLGRILMAQRDTKAAEACFQRARSFAPNDVESLARVGGALLQAGNRKGAEEVFAFAQSIKPKDLNTYRYIAQAWLKGGIPEPVHALVEKALDRAPRDTGPATDFASELLKVGRSEEAHALMDASFKGDPKAWDDFLTFGGGCLKHRQPEAAALWFHRALAGRPNDLRARRGLVAAYVEYGTPVDCQADRARLLECLEYGFPPKERDTEALVMIARCHLALGDRPKAEEIFRQIVMSKTVDAEAFRLIGQAWLLAGEEPEAFRAYEVVISAKGSGGIVGFGAGGGIATGRASAGWGAMVTIDFAKLNRKRAIADAAVDLATHGHLDKAIPLMEETYLTDAEDFDYPLQFADLCYEAGKSDEAVRFLALAGKTGHRDADFWFKAATILEAQARRPSSPAPAHP